MKIYGAYYNEDKIRMKSSSGGLFTLIAMYVLDRNGIVFGARFDEEFNVIHDCFDNFENIEFFRGSKYVQSKMGNTVLKIKKFLEQEKYVLFTGTPCQVAGLKNFLIKDYDKLITCDLICHGTPKPQIWQEYLKYIEKEHDSKVKYINFRDKTESWANYDIRIEFENGKICKSKINKNEFMWMFLNDYILTSNCYNCKYTNTNRVGDFTIGDFWGVNKKRPGLFDDKGTSLVFVNNIKAEKIFDNIKAKLVYEEISVEESLQKMLIKPAEKPENYDEFWEEYLKNGLVSAIRKIGFYER